MNRPKDRASSDGLLPRMEPRVWADGKTITYRYKLAPGKWKNLGTDRDAALRQVLDMNGRSVHHGSVGWLWEQWQTSKRCLRLAEGTRKDYALAWKQIEPHLGKLPALSVTAPMVARYVHVTREGSPRRADIEKALLSNLFKHGIMLGVCMVNPTIGVEPHGGSESPDLPETAAVEAFTHWLAGQNKQRQIFGCMLEFTAYGGSRRVEFRDLAKPQIDLDAGLIRLKRAKQRGRRRGEVIDVIRISPRMRELLQRVLALSEPDSLIVFPDRDGNAYGESAFKSMWARCIAEALTKGIIRPEQRFNFHALRHYFSTVHKAKFGKVPNLHADERITLQVYDHTTEEFRDAV